MSSSPPTEHRGWRTRPSRLRWRGPGGWSLRARLVATVSVLLAVVCLTVGATTEFALHRVLYHQIDERLAASAGRRPPPATEYRPAPQPADTPPEFTRGQQVGTLLALVVDGELRSGAVLDESADVRELGDEVAPTLAEVPTDGRPRSYDLPKLGDYRLVARQLPDGAVLVTGLPLAEVRAVLYGVAAVTGAVTLLALVVAGAAGAVIVDRTLRPLSRVAATAGRVAELRLDRGEVALAERVRDADPGTEVGQVGAALNRMLEHVGNALEARHASETQVRQFLADASHELRTPLAAIRGYAELSRRGRDVVPADVAHVLRRIESESQRMTALVEEMLLLARLDAGRPLLAEPVDLSALVVDAVSDAHATGPDHDWRLDLPKEPVTVTGDRGRLHQVLANLLANAGTHTPAGTRVTVGVANAGDTAVLRVADDGPGIPDTLLPHVFERFARGDSSRSRAAGSTGLGLSIVHAVVTAHSGTVAVRSRPGRTEFTVRLPGSAGSPADTGERDVSGGSD